MDWQDTLTVVRNHAASVNATLTANVGSIQVNSSPTGAALWLDGQSTGKTTNCVLATVPAGLHTIKLTKTDYWDWQDTVTVTLGGTAVRSATLQANPYPTQVIADIPLPSGSNATALAWNGANNRLYCANSGTGTVSVIDCATNQIVGTVGVGSNPSALAWNADNNTVYCVNNSFSSNTITVFSGATNAYITTIPVGSGAGDQQATALTWSAASNRVYYAGLADFRLYVIDGATNTLIDTSLYDWDFSNADAMTGNPTNGRIYVGGSDYNDNNAVMVIDGDSNRIITTVVVSGEGSLLDPEASIAWDQSDNRGYCGAGSVVSVLDGGTNQFTASISVSSYCSDVLTWVNANDKVYCACDNGSGNLDIIDCATNSVVDSLGSICDNSLGIAYNSTYNRVYVTYNNGSSEGIKVIGAQQ